MNLKELAWAAGFFDGEGTAILNGHQIMIAVAQVDRRPLDRFAAAVGFGRVRGPRTPTQPNRRPYYTWSVARFEHAQAFVALLWKYLSQPKREQLKRVLEAHRGYRATLRGRVANTNLCHPERPYAAKGKCKSCYNRQYREDAA